MGYWWCYYICVVVWVTSTACSHLLSTIAGQTHTRVLLTNPTTTPTPLPHCHPQPHTYDHPHSHPYHHSHPHLWYGLSKYLLCTSFRKDMSVPACTKLTEGWPDMRRGVLESPRLDMP